MPQQGPFQIPTIQRVVCLGKVEHDDRQFAGGPSSCDERPYRRKVVERIVDAATGYDSVLRRVHHAFQVSVESGCQYSEEYLVVVIEQRNRSTLLS